MNYEAKWLRARSGRSAMFVVTLAAFSCGVGNGPGGAPSETSGDLDPGVQVATVAINFGGTAYPALMNKLGHNQTWKEAKPVYLQTMDHSAQAASPMVSGLLELVGQTQRPGGGGHNEELPTGPGSTTCCPVLFSRDTTGVHSIPSIGLTSLRTYASAHGFINFLQIAGVPIWDDVFTPDAHYHQSDSQTGNTYPPPIPEQNVEFGNSLADFANMYSQPSLTPPPTIWSLWQEPNHTLGGRYTEDDGTETLVTNNQSVRRYLDFFTPFRKHLYRVDPDAMVAGMQLNTPMGIKDGIEGGSAFDGASYPGFIDSLLASEADAGMSNSDYPFDHFSIQNYGGDLLNYGVSRAMHNVYNSRIALQDARFNKTSFMFNEFDLGTFDTKPEKKFNSNAGVVAFLTVLDELLVQPDVSYVLLPNAAYESADEKDSEGPKALTYYPLEFVGRMSKLRRPETLTGSKDIRVLASGEEARAYVLLWNSGTMKTSVTLQMNNLPPDMRGVPLAVLVISGDQLPADRDTWTLGAGGSSLTKVLTLESQSVVMIEPRAVPEQRALGLSRAQVVRHRVWTGRLPVAEGTLPTTTPPPAPLGMGAFDMRTSTLVASAANENGIGLAGVTLADLPVGVPDKSYGIQVDLSQSGLPQSGGGVFGIRVDYVDNDPDDSHTPRLLKSVFFRDPDFTGANPWTRAPLNDDVTGWPSSSLSSTQVQEDFRAGPVRLEIERLAPTTAPSTDWVSLPRARQRLRLSLLLQGVNNATVTASLSDAN